MPPHPCGVQPEGNQLLSGAAHSCRDAGLGQLAILSDFLVLEVLGRLGEARDLAKLACASKALYCFVDHEDLWKALVLEHIGGSFTWRGSWKDTYMATTAGWTRAPTCTASAVAAVDGSGGRKPKKRRRRGLGGDAAAAAPERGVPVRAVRVTSFFSDLLYQPWHCATVELDPAWLEVDNVDRCSELTWQQFHERYEVPNLPVVLSDGAAAWPALTRWTLPYLRDAYGHRPVVAGNFELPFSTWADYASSTWDEMPLYLFDPRFAVPGAPLAQDYAVPPVFRDDLFSVLGDARPDYRWLIAGPARSGSSFHVDPNATSAWNAVVSGAKKWILYPPGVVPPGVHPSADGADVATPVSLIEWFLNFYDATKEGTVQPLECVCRPGEVMFVPSGWWHACLNLETWTVAVTQNFVSRANLRRVLDFLATGRADLVSGCAPEARGTLHAQFVAALHQHHPELLAAVEAERSAGRRKAEEARRLSALFRPPCGDAGRVEAGGAGVKAAAPAAAPPAAFAFGFQVT